jgi:OTU-like cysteine protease
MALDSSWGGSIEIIAATEMFKVNIEVYVRSSDPEWQYSLFASYKYPHRHECTKTICLIYTPFTHYDSMIDISIVRNINDIDNIGDEIQTTRFFNPATSPDNFHTTII